MQPTPTHTTSQNHSNETVAMRSDKALKSLVKLSHSPGCRFEKAAAVDLNSCAKCEWVVEDEADEMSRAMGDQART